jgi:peroxiredoxin
MRFALMIACCASLTLAAEIRKGAPDFTLKDSKGASIQLSKYKGKVVVLDFWATWCGGCKVEIPWFMEFQNKYQRGGLEVIGVSMDEDGWKFVKPFIDQKKLNYTIVLGNDGMAKSYGLDAMPMTLLIDRQGQIAATPIGMVDKNACENEIKALLQQAP